MKKIGIGYENYKDFIDKDMYYIDKTLLIRDTVEKGGQTTLFTRPRRFGKTLAMSTIRTFFEKEITRDGKVVDNSRYFAGKKIMEADGSILSMMGQYPVINLSLKGAKSDNFFDAFYALRFAIQDEFARHEYLIRSDRLSDKTNAAFKMIYADGSKWKELMGSLLSQDERENVITNEVALFRNSLKVLSQALKEYHRKNTIILIDEYDVPLESAYFNHYYDRMVGFMRSLFEAALKTNDNLEFAVVTGCLRISKESIFTGLNNLQICSIRNNDFGEYFGFTQEETSQMLIDYDMPQKEQEVMDWYDGYHFGESEIYNPWSVIKYVKDHVSKIDTLPESYWANTSSNAIIKDLIYRANGAGKDELEKLIAGGTIEKQIHEDITYDDIYKSDDNLWNFLFFTGYMKRISERHDGQDNYVTMTIPNKEVKSIYVNQIRDWFDTEIKNKADRSDLYKAITDKDGEAIGDYLTELLSKMISTFDSAESFYHGFFLSLLYEMSRYSARSNREEGEGRPDVVLYPTRPTDPAYIFEIKQRQKFNEMRGGIQEAFEQIDDRHYEDGIIDDGYAGVISFGMCFCKKSCIVEYKGERWEKELSVLH